MKIWLESDLHMEFANERDWQSDMPAVDTSKTDDVLLIAGDFINAEMMLERNAEVEKYFRTLCDRFNSVIFVPGNHEYYGCSSLNVDWSIVNLEWNKLSQRIPGLHFLNPGKVMIDDTEIVGCTLWTDFNKGNPLAMQNCDQMMNDMRAAGLSAAITAQIHSAHNAFLTEQLNADLTVGAVRRIVVTHHAPLINLLPESNYKNRTLDVGFGCTDMEDIFLDGKFNVWVHGHTHIPYQTTVDDKKIVCNPRGYYNENKLTKYKPVVV